MAKRYSLKAQIAEAKRQHAMMRGVYPDMIKAGQLKPAEADCDLSLMAAVVDTLEWVERNQARIKRALEPRERA